jgi:hypothetical protein
MSALAIVAICVGGLIAYCCAAAYVQARLVWYFKQRGTYDPSFAAGMTAVFLPVGIGVLVIYSLVPVETRTGGLAPRSVRREQKIKEQRETIA